jgi:Zn-finger nucleic acid-binding protein
LDRGELDKIIERSAGQQAAAQPSSQHAPPQQQWGSHGDRYGHPHSHGRQKRRKSFLEELFD